jgi:hypothetical protein
MTGSNILGKKFLVYRDWKSNGLPPSAAFAPIAITVFSLKKVKRGNRKSLNMRVST